MFGHFVIGPDAEWSISIKNQLVIFPLHYYRVRPLNDQERDRKDNRSIQFPGDGGLWVGGFGHSTYRIFNYKCVTMKRELFDYACIKHFPCWR